MGDGACPRERTVRWVLVLALMAVFVPIGACRDDATTDHVSTVPSPQPTPTSDDQGERAQFLARFLHQPIRGDRPFHTVAAYLDWLQRRPGTDSATADAVPEHDGGWRIIVTLRADDGQSVTAGCRAGLTTRFATTGVFWADCVAVTALWTAFAPARVATVAEVRPFLPPVPIFLPLVPPNSFTVLQVALPATPEQAWMNPFVFSVVFADAAGAQVTLTQQPAGLNTAIFPEYQTCVQGRWPSSGRCRAWGSMGAYFLLWSETASDDTLRAFEGAIDPRRR